MCCGAVETCASANWSTPFNCQYQVSKHLSVLKQAGLTGSTSEAMRMIDQGAVRINGERAEDKGHRLAWMPFGGLPLTLSIPWPTILRGAGFALALCLAMSLPPIAWLVGRKPAEP